jgi:hypothetical protein
MLWNTNSSRRINITHTFIWYQESTERPNREKWKNCWKRSSIHQPLNWWEKLEVGLWTTLQFIWLMMAQNTLLSSILIQRFVDFYVNMSVHYTVPMVPTPGTMGTVPIYGTSFQFEMPGGSQDAQPRARPRPPTQSLPEEESHQDQVQTLPVVGHWYGYFIGGIAQVQTYRCPAGIAGWSTPPHTCLPLGSDSNHALVDSLIILLFIIIMICDFVDLKWPSCGRPWHGAKSD